MLSTTSTSWRWTPGCRWSIQSLRWSQELTWWSGSSGWGWKRGLKCEPSVDVFLKSALWKSPPGGSRGAPAPPSGWHHPERTLFRGPHLRWRSKQWFPSRGGAPAASVHASGGPTHPHRDRSQRRWGRTEPLLLVLRWNNGGLTADFGCRRRGFCALWPHDCQAGGVGGGPLCCLKETALLFAAVQCEGWSTFEPVNHQNRSQHAALWF